MALFDRLNRVIRANLNDLIGKAEDPEKMLEQLIIDMNEDLIKLRQAVAKAIAEQKRTQVQYEQNLTEATKWESRAKLALQKGDETLAREALSRKKALTDSANTQKPLLEQQNASVDQLRKNLLALEAKISEAQTKKSNLIARAKAAKANEEIQKIVGGMSLNGSVSAFERMENKVLEMEASSQAAGELGGTGLEQQFAALESGSDVEDELAALKAQVSGAALPPASSPAAESLRLAADSLDDELAKLKANNQ